MGASKTHVVAMLGGCWTTLNVWAGVKVWDTCWHVEQAASSTCDPTLLSMPVLPAKVRNQAARATRCGRKTPPTCSRQRRRSPSRRPPPGGTAPGWPAACHCRRRTQTPGRGGCLQERAQGGIQHMRPRRGVRPCSCLQKRPVMPCAYNVLEAARPNEHDSAFAQYMELKPRNP